jgi:predicted TIM-barrel enzyme
VSGTATGKPTDEVEVRRARRGAPDAPILIGSGIDASNVRALLGVADGAIVGTSFKVDSQIENPVDLTRVQTLVQLAKS